MEMRLRVIDIETTGGLPSEIIEIAAVDVVVTDEGWKPEPPRSRLFRPIGPITIHAMAIHHLTPDDFDDAVAPCSDARLREFLIANGHPDFLIAHNASFESQHISAAVTEGLEWICTVKSARNAWPDAPGYSNQMLRYWRGMRLDPSLAMPPHRAGPDAWVTAHILIDLLRTASVHDLLGWTQAPRRLDRIPFGRYRGRDWTIPPSDYLRWLVGEPDMADDVLARARKELADRELVPPSVG
jgi:exodeoxyribonuclease X